MWKTALLMGKENHLLDGVIKIFKTNGWSMLKNQFQILSLWNCNHAHNDFLEMWARRGIIGIIALIGIYLIPILLIISFYRKKQLHHKK